MRPSTRQVATRRGAEQTHQPPREAGTWTSMSHLAVAAGVVGEPGRVLAPVGPTDAPWGKGPAPLPTRHGKVWVTARGVRR